MDEVLQDMADAAGIPYSGATEQEQPEPQIDRTVTGDYLFTWETNNGEYVRVKCADVAFVKSEMHTRLSVQYKSHKGAKPRTLLSRKRWIPESNSSTSSQYTELNRWKGVSLDWPAILTWVATYFEDNFETGDPLVWLDEVTDPGPLSYLVEPLVQLNEHTLVGAKGGSLKSMTALGVTLSLATGETIIPGLTPREKGVKCLYLDYETNAATHKRRLLGLAKAKGLDIPTGLIGYKRLTTPLVQMKSELQQLIALQGFQFVVIDSVGRAVGGETVGEADVQAYYNACSAFNATVMSIGHTSKGNGETVAGNAQWEFQARSMWIFEAAREHGSNAVVIGMHHRKVNEGELLPSLNFAVTFGETGGISYSSAEAEDLSQLTGTDLKTAIRIFLLSNPNSTAREIAEALDKSEPRVANVLKSWAGREWQSDSGRPAKWIVLHGVNSPVNGDGNIEPPIRGSYISPNSRGHEKTEGEKSAQWWMDDGEESFG